MKRIGILLIAAGASWSQEAERRIEVKRIEVGTPGSRGNMVWVNTAGDAVVPPEGRVEFLMAEAGPPGMTVTGAPYTGEGISNTTQVLADGTRITRRNTKKFARDSKGRTREEITLGAMGPWAAAGEARRMVHIVDPVAGQVIVLNEKDKTARRIRIPAGASPGVRQEVRVERRVKAGSPAVEQDVVMIRRQGGDGTKEESLGKQTLDGLAVEGKRITHAIPAGEIGNDRPIVSVTEQWYSPELHVTVRSHTRDPQFGETDYRLTGVQRGEPAASLFEVPADYTVKEGQEGPVFERRIERK
jgi:hypothetical protein